MSQISVIVPVYKVEPYLRRCVDSILAQTFVDFELILVDDGSPDNCGVICDEYAKKDGRVTVIHQENGGLSAARNAAIDWTFANSDSQWLTFIDSDDWVHPEYLESLLKAVEETGCQIAVSGLLRTTGMALPLCPPKDKFEVITANEFYCNRAGENISPAAACAKLYKKSLFSSIRFPVGKLHEDEFTTYLLIYQAGTIALFPALLYAYFSNPDGIMCLKWTPRKLDAIEAYENQLKFAKNTNNSVLYARVLYLQTLNLAMQCSTVEHMMVEDAELKNYHRMLRKKLRKSLRYAAHFSLFPIQTTEHHWLYHQAYPLQMILINKIRKGWQ